MRTARIMMSHGISPAFGKGVEERCALCFFFAAVSGVADRGRVRSNLEENPDLKLRPNMLLLNIILLLTRHYICMLVNSGKIKTLL